MPWEGQLMESEVSEQWRYPANGFCFLHWTCLINHPNLGSFPVPKKLSNIVSDIFIGAYELT